MKLGTGLAKTIRGVAQARSSGTQRIGDERPATPATATILDSIAVYVGPRTAQSAIVAGCRVIGREPEHVEVHDVPELLNALRPMLATLLGGASCRILIRRIERDLSL
jgi:hypothetical protein